MLLCKSGCESGKIDHPYNDNVVCVYPVLGYVRFNFMPKSVANDSIGTSWLTKQVPTPSCPPRIDDTTEWPYTHLPPRSHREQ